MSPITELALKDKARHQRLQGCDPNDLRKRQRQARLLRHWTDELGLGCVAVRMLPEQATAVMARLDHRTEQLRRQARREGKESAGCPCRRAVEVADSAIAPRDEGGRQVGPPLPGMTDWQPRRRIDAAVRSRSMS